MDSEAAHSGPTERRASHTTSSSDRPATNIAPAPPADACSASLLLDEHDPAVSESSPLEVDLDSDPWPDEAELARSPGQRALQRRRQEKEAQRWRDEAAALGSIQLEAHEEAEQKLEQQMVDQERAAEKIVQQIADVFAPSTTLPPYLPISITHGGVADYEGDVEQAVWRSPHTAVEFAQPPPPIAGAASIRSQHPSCLSHQIASSSHATMYLPPSDGTQAPTQPHSILPASSSLSLQQLEQRECALVECVIQPVVLDDERKEPEQLEYCVRILPVRSCDASWKLDASPKIPFYRPIAPSWTHSTPAEAAAHALRLSRLPPLPKGRHAIRKQQLDEWQKHWEGLNTSDRISRLPNEMIGHILLFVSPLDNASSVTRVSKRWKRLADSRALWRVMTKQTYAVPQPGQATKVYYQHRHTTDVARAKGYNIPSIDQLVTEGSTWMLPRYFIKACNSGSAGILHATAYLVFLILFTIRLGEFSGSAGWRWIWVFFPLLFSHGLFQLAVFSFFLLTCGPRGFWRSICAEMHGLVHWWVLVTMLLFARPRAQGVHLPHQRPYVSIGVPKIRHVATVGTLLSGYHLATILALVKLEAQRDCQCEDQTIQWVHVAIPAIFPLFTLWMYVLSGQLLLWRRARHQWRNNRCCSAVRWLMPVWPARTLMVIWSETSGIIASLLMVAVSIDAYRRDATRGRAASDAPFYLRPHWGYLCLLPMWLAHSLCFLYLECYFWRFTAIFIHWGGSRARRAFNVVLYFTWKISANLCARSFVLAVEIMLAWNLQHQFNALKQAHDEANSTSATSDRSSAINPGFLIIPLVIVFGCVALCMWCPYSVGEIRRRRRREMGY